MKNTTRLLFLIASLFVALLNGCVSVGPDYQIPVAEVPVSYKAAQKKTTQAIRKDRWWNAFGDADLNRLMAQVERENLTVRVAMERAAQSRAQVKNARAGQLPNIDASAASKREASSPNSRLGSFGERINDSYDTGFQFGYEVDFWGKVRRQIESASANAEAAEAAQATAMLSVKTNLARQYFSLRSMDAEIALLESTLETRRESLKLVENQQSLGGATALDSSRARSLVATAAGDLEELRGQRGALENSIAVLVGRNPSDFSLSARDSWNPTVPVIPAGVPGDLLVRRPDVFETERQLAAASADIGVATAAFYPSVSLTGSGGLSSVSAADFLQWSSRRWAIGPELTLPVFDGGRNHANLEQAKSRYNEALATHQSQVLKAFEDVETALHALQSLRREKAARNEAVDAFDATSKLARLRKDQGVGTSLDIYDADRDSLNARRASIRVSGNQFLKTVELIQALGGGWKRF